MQQEHIKVPVTMVIGKEVAEVSGELSVGFHEKEPSKAGRKFTILLQIGLNTFMQVGLTPDEVVKILTFWIQKIKKLASLPEHRGDYIDFEPV